MVSLDDSVAPSGLLDEADWELRLAPSEAALGVSMAVKLLLTGQEEHPACADPVFDEKCGSITSDSYGWERATDVPLGCIFFTICQFTKALDTGDDSGIVIHALLLLERLIRRVPGVLRGSTLRPLLLTAFSLSAKSYFDEQLSDIVPALRQLGVDTITAERLLELELAFLGHIGWKIGSPRHVYATYVFEVRSLISSQRALLAGEYADLVDAARSLDGVSVAREDLVARPPGPPP